MTSNRINEASAAPESKEELIIISSKFPSAIIPTEQPGNAFDQFTRWDTHIKITVVGAKGVGKSRLLQKYENAKFEASDDSPLAYSVVMNGLTMDNKKVLTNVHEATSSSLISNSDVIVAVFDLTMPASFQEIDELVKKHKIGHNPPIILIAGTHADEPEKRAVDKATAEELAKKHFPHVKAYIETSAKTGENVQEIFHIAAKLVLEKRTHQADVDSRNPLKIGLEAYINRIESHKLPDQKPNFSYGFWFFKNSRAANREANYYLAKQYLADLKANKPIKEVFEDTAGKRTAIINSHGIFNRPNYTNRGINSTELKAIIEKAQKASQIAPALKK